MNYPLIAESHPKHYLLHKYWGRKPHNIIKAYINKYSKKRETVFDPFMGSGVTIIESLKLHRKAIGIDLNPLSYFITRVTLENINLDNFKEHFNSIVDSSQDIEKQIYVTKCARCKGNALIANTIWEGEVPKRIRGLCEKCGIFLKDPDINDKKNIKFLETNFQNLCNKYNIRNIPNENIIRYVKRSGASKITDLFSTRNVIALGILKSKIDQVKELSCRDLLNLSFSSLLPNVSSMIPGNAIKGTGRSGWVISKMYIPRIHTEKNVFLAFRQRLNTILEGKRELNLKSSDKKVKLLNISSENIQGILKDNSVDYIFTDPPYGENIPYFGCSMLFNSWLGFCSDYSNEIICDNYRGKNIEDYKIRMSSVMKECCRVLKPNKFMTVTFNNRDFKIWKVILESICGNGFILNHINHHHSAVTSGTQGLNRESAIKGDFFYTFKKTKKVKPQKQLELSLFSYKDLESYLIKLIREVIDRKNGATISEIYENLIPILVNNNMMGKCAEYLNNFDTILSNHFILISEKNKQTKMPEYKWGIKESF
ncbi:MAG: DNA methyltransferase [Candidatus Omnitrophica bacterium]|nr:DNA methyltransferase [Candidatus Omnitrophota bacterium]